MRENNPMNYGGFRMNRWNGLILALVTAVVTACASGGGGGDVQDPGGNEPRDNQYTRAAGVALAKAVTAGEDEQAEADAAYQEALTNAMQAIQVSPTNPKAYLMAAQASVGVNEWVQADTMFDRALELYPGYAETVKSERETGWVRAHNLGIAALNNNDIEQAIALFEAADMLYDGRPEALMNLGWAQNRVGNTAAAAEAYVAALDILWGPEADNLPEEQVAAWEEDEEIAAFNAAQFLADLGRYAEAAEIMGRYMTENEGTLTQAQHLQALSARANFLAGAGEAEAAEALYDELLSRDDLTSADYFQIGVGFFNTDDYARAADAFAQSVEMNPYSRDAILNLVQSQYQEAFDMERQEGELTAEQRTRLEYLYSQIIENAQAFRQFDPLNRNVLTFILRAYRGLADLGVGDQAEVTRKIQETYSLYEGLPWAVENLSLTVHEDGRATIAGELLTQAGEPGTQVQLRFTVMNERGGALATETVTVTAASKGSTATFSTQVDASGGQVAGLKYELVQ